MVGEVEIVEAFEVASVETVEIVEAFEVASVETVETVEASEAGEVEDEVKEPRWRSIRQSPFPHQ